MDSAPLRIVMLRPTSGNAASCATIAGGYVSGEMAELTTNKLYVIFTELILLGVLPPARRSKLFHERSAYYQACDINGYTWLDRELL